MYRQTCNHVLCSTTFHLFLSILFSWQLNWKFYCHHTNCKAFVSSYVQRNGQGNQDNKKSCWRDENLGKFNSPINDRPAVEKYKTTEEKLLYVKSMECTKVWGPVWKNVGIFSLRKNISALQTSSYKGWKENKKRENVTNLLKRFGDIIFLMWTINLIVIIIVIGTHFYFLL